MDLLIATIRKGLINNGGRLNYPNIDKHRSVNHRPVDFNIVPVGA